ncbi:MAG: 30S ribosomal protein S9 [Deltaproteobacteria bacterium]|nr:30S ribosomal protein S9 [Deltaproteobacteria bacterium]
MPKKIQEFYATGRRKTSVARVYLRPQSKEKDFQVNGRKFEEYFVRPTSRTTILEPLVLTNNKESFDVVVKVKGGGSVGQAEAVRHGLSRALVDFNAELRTTLKKAGLLTRDSRAKERKKYGQRGARARYQFSKR